ncbi:MAG TPA: protein translocase subunit SecF, partial [Anaerolineae bacterium]|nr:protein translocase subunit SecF [Anaerolineae bacterium]
LVAVVTGLLFILATLIPNGNVGLQFSIAYTGGTVWEVHFEDGTPDPVAVRAVLEEQGLPGSEVAITSSDERDYVLIRTEALTLQAPQISEGSAAAAVAAELASAAPDASAEPAISAAPAASAEAAASPAIDSSPEPEPSAEPEASVAPVAAEVDGPPTVGVTTEGQFGELATALQEAFGRIDEVRQENSVGPVVSAELVQQTFLLILMAAAAIMIWVSYRFRDFRMGASTVVALLHDVIVVVGVFAVLGTFIGLQIDALFVTAMLTVIGYSVHDTIVVFDRIRENRQRYLGEPLELITNQSLVQTLGRSITTSLTLVLTLLALLLFGGEAIRPFTLALLMGVVAGTYSSLFVATPLFLDWHLLADRRKASQPLDTKAKAKTSTA